VGVLSSTHHHLYSTYRLSYINITDIAITRKVDICNVFTNSLLTHLLTLRLNLTQASFI